MVRRSFDLKRLTRQTTSGQMRRAFIVIAAAVSFACPGCGAELALMPQPAHLRVLADKGGLAIGPGFTAAVTGDGGSDPRIAKLMPRFLDRLTRQTGIFVRKTPVADAASATFVLTVEHRDHAGPQRLADDERYTLTVDATQAKLTAPTALGALRGVETFLQLVQPGMEGFAAAPVAIEDAPRFPWRGLSLDISRHFIPALDVERTIGGMTAVKLNVLHWHLSDDQGFRVESKVFPKLQEFGSDGMYYTQAEIRDVIQYARDRGIRVVPEFDMPGHAAAMLAAYPELGSGPGPYAIIREFGIFAPLINPTAESTYRFLDKFIGEMAALFPDEYFHIGGDEVKPDEWNNSVSIREFMARHGIADAHALQAYFNRRVQGIVARHGKHMVGWDEVLAPSLPKSIVIESWRGQDSLAAAARQGYQGILSAGYYLDLMHPAAEHYAVDPMKGATAQLTESEKKRILGGEAAMWEELATQQNLDLKLWPRLAAIAERLWSPEDVTDVRSMYRRLEMTSRWLTWSGLHQREIPREMQERLTGEEPVTPLRTFASTLEPVKEYTRTDTVGGYTTSTPLNRLVDSLPPESDTARRFRNRVDRFLGRGATGDEDAAEIRREIVGWLENIPRVLPVLRSNKVLLEAAPVADNESVLCEAALLALRAVSQQDQGAVALVRRIAPAVDEAAKSTKAEVVIAIAPAVQKLVSAATSGERR